MSSVATLPTIPAMSSVEEEARWYAENKEEIAVFSSRLYGIRRRLTEYVREFGPIATPAGRVEIEPSGYAWDAQAVGSVMPALIANAVLHVSGSAEDVCRVMSLAEEECPEVECSLELAVDKTAANRVIRAGGEAARKLEGCRKPEGKLGVTQCFNMK